MKLAINGGSVVVPEKHRDATLLDFLRDFAGLTGTKFGCGIGSCGACTVHIDGLATRSCQISVAEVADSEITTIEGLAQTTAGQALHPVQQAWIEEGVPQCGYCQPGQIMTAAAFLRRNPDPTEAEIRTEMSGNLCRCGTYGRIRRAVARAAAQAARES
ncbi:Isoquinoline 1-oxidoreductase alpha subunit [hydrothermal vent metagenome]|uniref:Isoquinoline 1-oxidoreductase alpha subunit n=1 Tax=hydrothermal vent metagenome TaxID=652676 RepID=A0A3B0TD23_9ZZZZ